MKILNLWQLIKQKIALNPRVFALAVLCVGLSISVNLWHFYENQAKQYLQLRFDARRLQILDHIRSGLLGNVNVLRATQSFINASEYVKKDEFHEYAHNLDAILKHNGMQGVGLALSANAFDSGKLQTRLRKEGISDFRIYPDTSSDLIAPIIYLEPSNPQNQRAIGFDMYSEAGRSAALEKARDVGDIVMSAKVHLIQDDTKSAQNGVIIYLPLYKHGSSNGSVTERRANIVGWVFATYRVNEIMAAILGKDTDYIDVNIYDGLKMDDAHLLYQSDPAPPELDPDLTGFTHLEKFEIANRTWTIQLKPSKSAIWAIDNKTKVILIAGIISSLFLSIITYLLLSSRRIAVQLAEKLAEDVIEKENRFRLLFENIAAPMLILDPLQGVFVDWNKAALAMLGYEDKSMISTLGPADISPKIQPDGRDSAEKALEMMAIALKQGSHRFEWVICGPHQEALLIEVLLTAAFMNGRQIFITTWRDLTQQKLWESELKKSETHFRTLFEQAAVGVVVRSVLTEEISQVNQRYCDIVGYSVEEMMHIKFRDISHPEDQIQHDKLNLQMIRGDLNEYSIEKRYFHKNGKTIWVYVTCSALWGKGEKPSNIVAVCVDVSSKKEAELLLLKSQEKWKFALEGSGQGLWEIDLGANKIYLSEEVKKNFGYTDIELETDLDAWFSFVHPDDIEQLRADRQEVLDGIRPFFVNEHRKLTKAEGWKWTMVRGMVSERDDKDIPLRLLGTYLDISKRKADEQEFELLALVAQKTASSVIITDADERIEWVNPAFEALTGYSFDEVVGKSPQIFQGEDTDKAVLKHIRDCLNKKIGLNVQLVNYHKNGTKYWVNIAIDPVFDSKQKLSHYIAVQTDVTQHRLAADALKYAEQRWRFALEGSGAGAWDWNVINNTIEYSKQYNLLLGFEENEIASTYDAWEERLHPDDLAPTLKNLNDYLNGEMPIYINEHRLQCKDGSYKWFLARGMIVEKTAEGRPLRMIGTHIDINNRKQAEKEIQNLNDSLEQKILDRTHELETARDEADKANQAKSQFLSNMSHEIRTPLNAVIGMTYLALGNELVPKVRDYIEKIETTSQHLLKIISDVLDFSKIEAGMLQLDIETFDIKLLIEDLSSLFAESLNEKQLDFQISVDSKISKVLSGDALRLKQILINFIGNAIKFTDVGGIELQVTQVEAVDNQCLLRFEIRDTGIGLSEEDAAILFQPFQQADSSNNRQFGGTGLGLAISKRIAHAMGGEIGCESEMGKGSTFWFTAKLAGAERSSKRATDLVYSTIERDLAVLKGKRILVAEDNMFNQQVTTEILEQAGAIVAIAENGVKALKMLRTQEFDCILMDVQMPVMDGYETTKLIRQQSQWKNLPIIAITANAFNKDRRLCLEAGMNDFVSKPIKPKLLFTTIANSLRLFDSSAPVTAIELQPYSPRRSTDMLEAGQDKHINLALLEDIVGNDPQKLNKFKVMFIDSVVKGIDEIHQAIGERDLGHAGKVGHRIKGPALSVGATVFAGLCAQLETLEGDDAQHAATIILNNMQQELEIIKQKVAVTDDTRKHSSELLSANLRFLIVDDESFHIALLSNLLSELSTETVQSFLSAESALEFIQTSNYQPDIIICDLSMPEMDGIEFMRHLAKNNYKGGFILLSGLDNSLLKTGERLAYAHGLNFLGSIEKPFVKHHLIATIAEYTQVQPTSFIPSKRVNFTVEDLKGAITREEIVLYCQPKVSTDDKSVCGAESLARWQHPQLGLVTPDKFIQLAEDTGLIDELTMLIFRKSVEQVALWKEAGHDLKISVNVSINNLNKLVLPEELEVITKLAGVEPKNVTLELTESRLLDNYSTTLDIISRLRIKGFGLSIDDFGTGFSTMENLQQLPFTELKIDRAFVHNACNDKAAHAIFKSSVNLARTFNLSVVAEGVENAADWDLALNLGCEEIQGYLVSRPMPAEQFLNWMEKWNSEKE